MAFPPPGVKGQKWKNFVFYEAILPGRKQDILGILRSRQHGRTSCDEFVQNDKVERGA